MESADRSLQFDLDCECVHFNLPFSQPDRVKKCLTRSQQLRILMSSIAETHFLRRSKLCRTCVM